MLLRMSSGQMAAWSAFFKARKLPRGERQRSLSAWRRMSEEEKRAQQKALYAGFRDWAVMARGKKRG